MKPRALLLTGLLLLTMSGCRMTSFDDENVNASSGSGEVRISRMGGGIDVANAPHGASLSTMGGNIHVGNVAESATVKTMGGSIDIDQSSGPVDANTMGGAITVATANGRVKASTMGGDVTVRETGSSTGERDIDLSSKGGRIELTVPRDFPMDVKITLAYTSGHQGNHIEQNAGLHVSETSDWDISQGTPRRYIRASGRVGSGLNKVTIDTVNGDVILRQE